MPSRHTGPRRPIRSYVRREGRFSAGQKRALQRLWPRYGVEVRGRLNLDTFFGRRAVRTLEIGFGNGDTLVYLAQQNPRRDYLGIEVHRPGIGHLLLEAERRELTNLRVICADAVAVLRNHLPDACLDQILILFPDPWPKQRHHKRRLIQPDFIDLLGKTLKTGGELHLATDWEPYAGHMRTVMDQAGDFTNASRPGDFAQRPADTPITRFEQRGKRLGHRIWNLRFARN